MTATLERQAVSPVARPLARVEALRALRRPLTWLGFLASLWMLWSLIGTWAPVLQLDSVNLAGALLPLMAAALLVTFSATIRERDAAELLQPLPGGRNRRMVGIYLGNAVAFMVLGVVAQVAGVVYLLMGDPIGSFNWWEVAAGPAAIALTAGIGMILGRRIPHPIVAPAILLGLAYYQAVSAPYTGIDWWHEAGLDFLAPWLPAHTFRPLETLAERPSVLRVSYFILASAVLVFWSMKLTRRGRTTLIGGTAALVVGLAVTMTSIDLVGGWNEWQSASANQTCLEADSVEYCAYPATEAWIPRWQNVVGEVDALFPVDLDLVVQRPTNIGWDDNSGVPQTGHVIQTALLWDRPGSLPLAAFDLALPAAQSAVGLPAQPTERQYTVEEIEALISDNPQMPPDFFWDMLESGETTISSCAAQDQARAVVAVWLAGVAVRGSEPIFAHRAAGTWPEVFFPGHAWNGVDVHVADYALARDLLALPAALVHAELQARWADVLDPATTAADLASWFGLDAPSYDDPPTAPPCP